MAAVAPPLTLRDLLELSCESSCSDGFRTYPRRLPCHGHDGALRAKAEEEEDAAPVRLLIEADLRRSPSRTLSSILFPRSPGSLATVSRLTRSLSRRLVFWRRHRGDDDKSDAGERDSLGLPSPVVSSCSASQCSDLESVAEAPDLLVDREQQESSGESDQSEIPSPSTSSGCTRDNGVAGGDGHKVADGDPTGSSSAESMEDKQQLSPVSVMDFPFHDEDDDGDERSDAGTCSTSFLQCQPGLERPDSMLHKIRRLDGLLLAQAAVDPVDLGPRFVASDDEPGASVSDDTLAQSGSSTDQLDSAASTTGSLDDEQEQSCADDAECDPDSRHRLLAQVLKDDDDDTAATTDVATERLLLDFFAEGLDRRRSPKAAGPVVGSVKTTHHIHEGAAALVRAAKEWVQGKGTQWGVEDVLFAGPAALADMDREQRWACVGEEEREVGATMEALLVDALVAELVRDMTTRC